MSYLAGGKGGGPRPTNGVDNSDPISSAIVKYNYQVQEYLLSTGCFSPLQVILSGSIKIDFSFKID